MSTPVPPGVTCSPEDWQLSHDIPPNTVQQVKCLASSDSVGLTVIAAVGTCSLITTTYVLYRVAKRMWHLARSESGRILDIFNQTPAILMLSLFLADVLQSIGAMLSIRWIAMGKVEVGAFCTAQGVVKQLSATAVALATLTIAIQTFLTIIRNKTIDSKMTMLAIASLTWITPAIVILIGNLTPRADKKNFIAPTPYWCWITKPYIYGWGIGGEYFWFWLALLVSLATNGMLFLWLRGNIAIQYEEATFTQKVVFQSSKRTPRPYTRLEFMRRQNAVIMLAYPLVYSITIVPLSVVRWIAFSQGRNQSTIPGAATLAVSAIHASNGLLNAILFLTSRRGSSLFSEDQDASDVALDDLGHVNLNPPANQSEVYVPDIGSSAGSGVGPEHVEFSPLSIIKTASSEAVYTYS